MNHEKPEPVFEKNLEKLMKGCFAGSDAEYEKQLKSAVLAEVQAERSRNKSHLTVKWPRWAVAAAAGLMIATAVVWFHQRPANGGIGQVKNVYGLVEVKNEGQSPSITASREIRSGQWIRTLSGSRAEIILKDLSRLVTRPRTMVKIEERKEGPKIVLQEGYLSIEAAKQSSGKSIDIETQAGHITVLGTRLDVQAVQKTGGGTQTQVSVYSGSVELDGGGARMLLLANTQGILDEGAMPRRLSLIEEVNEMNRLAELSEQLAVKANQPIGTPAIVDFQTDGSATVWLIVNADKLQKTAEKRYLLKFKYPTQNVQAFSKEGFEGAVSKADENWMVNFSDRPEAAGPVNQIILKLAHIKGLFRSDGAGVFQFDRPGDVAIGFNVLQFRLPEAAAIEEISPEFIEKDKKRGKLLITMATNASLPIFLE
jgi:hypothetical protein